MTEAEQRLLNQLSDMDSLELRGGKSSSSAVGASLGNIVGNPNFKAQFNLNVKTKFYGEYSTAPNNIGVATPAQLPESLKTQLPMMAFGTADFSGGYERARNLIPLQGWSYDSFSVVGKDVVDPLDALGDDVVSFTQAGVAKTGDMLIRIKAKNLSGDSTFSGNFWYAEILISCPQVAYGTLLDSSSSDSFIINMIRYTVPEGQELQFQNQIRLLQQTLFGKAGDDKVDPQTYITGGTFNKNIADIPLEFLIDKNHGLHSYINYDIQAFSWTVTVFAIKKTTI